MLKKFSLLVATAISANTFSAEFPGPVTINYLGTDYQVIAEQYSGAPTGNFLTRLQQTPWYNPTPTSNNPSAPEYLFVKHLSEQFNLQVNPSRDRALWPNNLIGNGEGPYIAYYIESITGSKLYGYVVFDGDFNYTHYDRLTTSTNNAGIDIQGLNWWLLPFASGPSTLDTLLSLYPNASALRNTFNLQSAKIAQGLTYDCTVFDANNMCVSFAGTRSNGGDTLDNTTGALIIAHRPTANIRVGAYVDQTIGTTDSMGLKVKRGSPGYGVFGVWSQRTDGLGTQVRAAANSGKVDIETTRLAIETAEPGFGQSNIKSNGVQLEASQGYALNNQWTTRPYVGYRQMTNKRGAYTEQTSASVEYPLAYTALKQTTESILAGIRFVGKLTPQTSLNLSAGVERDVKSTVDNYQASFVDGEAIDPISMTQNIKKTRPTASVGLVHSLDKTQTVGLFVTHRKEALQSSSTTSGMLQYSVGF